VLPSAKGTADRDGGAEGEQADARDVQHARHLQDGEHAKQREERGAQPQLRRRIDAAHRTRSDPEDTRGDQQDSDVHERGDPERVR
jgi:hypothetical protein